MRDRPNALARALREFLSSHLPQLRALSPHTIRSYRDSLVLFLRFLAAHKKRSAAKLDLADLGAQEVEAFIRHLAKERHNASSTSNVRLAAIHSFFRFVATRWPDHLEHCQRVLAIPFKRTRQRAIEYLELEEIEAVLGSVDRTTLRGRRDYALLATMFNTGARVQEILDLRPRDLQLLKPYHVRLCGKGRKERICPLWPQTAKLLQALIAEIGQDTSDRQPLFTNRWTEPLTRFGVRYILAKYCRRAGSAKPSLAAKRLHPHSMRHSTAIHLLRSGVDLATISRWLGHVSLDTTNRYITIDLDAKRKALEKLGTPGMNDLETMPWHSDHALLDWLEAL